MNSFLLPLQSDGIDYGRNSITNIYDSFSVEVQGCHKKIVHCVTKFDECRTLFLLNVADASDKSLADRMSTANDILHIASGSCLQLSKVPFDRKQS
jgi:hypothetical protein